MNKKIIQYHLQLQNEKREKWGETEAGDQRAEHPSEPHEQAVEALGTWTAKDNPSKQAAKHRDVTWC